MMNTNRLIGRHNTCILKVRRKYIHTQRNNIYYNNIQNYAKTNGIKYDTFKNCRFFHITKNLKEKNFSTVSNAKNIKNLNNEYEKVTESINSINANKDGLHSSSGDKGNNPNNINTNTSNVNNTNPNEMADEIEKGGKKKFRKTKLLFYGITTLFGLYVSYKIYKNDMNLSKAEESIVKDFMNLIYTYEEKMSVKNSQFMTCLDENMNKQIAMYFLQLDNDKASGFLINDALKFLEELNINTDNTIVKDFIKTGKGKNYELKKLSGCTLQQFAGLIESLILESKTKNIVGTLSDDILPPFITKSENYYIKILNEYLIKFLNYIQTTNLYLYYVMKKNSDSSNNNDNTNVEKIEETLTELEKSILEKLTKYNDKYADKKLLSLEYLLSKQELNQLRNNNLVKKDEESELLLIEKKKIEEKIQMLLNLQKKRNLTETDIKRLQNLKERLKNVKFEIKKEKIKKYFT
ncbi:conserved protein, unknown function [Hepatocystis sp. ex Piliocolobus tephrosceles]|nr:conserved protein, unknown function [Hepatocystis sp. ex Piliocolobus tephrosceles]